MSDRTRDETYDEFYDCVNMQPKELEEWLETEESKSVGDNDDGESTGHRSGRRIVEVKRTNKDELTDSQWDHMDTGHRLCASPHGAASPMAISRTATGATAS